MADKQGTEERSREMHKGDRLYILSRRGYYNDVQSISIHPNLSEARQSAISAAKKDGCDFLEWFKGNTPIGASRLVLESAYFSIYEVEIDFC